MIRILEYHKTLLEFMKDSSFFENELKVFCIMENWKHKNLRLKKHGLKKQFIDNLKFDRMMKIYGLSKYERKRKNRILDKKRRL